MIHYLLVFMLVTVTVTVLQLNGIHMNRFYRLLYIAILSVTYFPITNVHNIFQGVMNIRFYQMMRGFLYKVSFSTTQEGRQTSRQNWN